MPASADPSLTTSSGWAAALFALTVVTGCANNDTVSEAPRARGTDTASPGTLVVPSSGAISLGLDWRPPNVVTFVYGAICVEDSDQTAVTLTGAVPSADSETLRVTDIGIFDYRNVEEVEGAVFRPLAQTPLGTGERTVDIDCSGEDGLEPWLALEATARPDNREDTVSTPSFLVEYESGGQQRSVELPMGLTLCPPGSNGNC